MPAMMGRLRAEGATGAALRPEPARSLQTLLESAKTLARAKEECSGQRKGLGPGCRRKTSAGSQMKEGLLHESLCNGPLVLNKL